MASGLTCSMMLHFQIQTFIFHQSFLQYYIKRQFWAKMCPQPPPLLAGLAWNLISLHIYLVQTFVTSAGFCIMGAVKYFVYLNMQSGGCVWVMGLFLCAAAVWYDSHSLNPPKDVTAVTVKSGVFHSPCCSVNWLALKDLRLWFFFALFCSVSFQSLHMQHIQTSTANSN